MHEAILSPDPIKKSAIIPLNFVYPVLKSLPPTNVLFSSANWITPY